MANIDADDLEINIVHAGTFGNKSVAHKQINSKPNNGDVLRFFELPAGSTIYGAREVHGALGTGVTMSLGYQPVDGSAADNVAIAAAASVAAAGDSYMAKVPVVLAKDSYIVGVIGGANAASAQNVDLVVDYEYRGL